MRAQDVESSGVFGDNIDDEIDVKQVGPRVALRPRVRQFGWQLCSEDPAGREVRAGWLCLHMQLGW